MKRYGDNLPSSCEDESENEHGGAAQVIRGGCSVRFEMLDFIMSAEPPKKHKPRYSFNFLKLGQKQTNVIPE
jgi:hypothetical protein